MLACHVVVRAIKKAGMDKLAGIVATTGHATILDAKEAGLTKDDESFSRI